MDTTRNLKFVLGINKKPVE